MNKEKNKNILKAFDNYKKIVFPTTNDINFWHSVVKWAISEYQSKPPSLGINFESVFTTHDLDYKSFHGLLKVHKEIFTIKTIHLESHSQSFFIWVMNLSIIKIYNASETFLLNTIGFIYFPNIKYRNNNKKFHELIQREIKNHLKHKNFKFDTKNNKHLILFLKSKSSKFKTFINRKINVDLNTKWEDFFELISILRNVIAHQGMAVTLDNINEINSKAKDVFQKHFNLSEDLDGYLQILPDKERFVGFIDLINKFTLNTIKFIADKPDFTFLEMK